MKRKPTYLKGRKPGKPGTCCRCGKPIKGQPVMLELDRRTGEYHDFGGVDEDDSQGCFEFGPDCAVIARMNAHYAMDNAGIPVPGEYRNS